ncbi:MAG: phosphate uptake regulator PhoU [Flavobacteriaceae bacterium]|nr:phosphate uptake regulator PhoU [Flavobacteriaceae bacterium]
MNTLLENLVKFDKIDGAMNTKKEITQNKIDKEFLKLSTLTIEQFKILSNILKQPQPEIPAEVLKKLEKNEKNINKLDLKLDNHIIKTIVLYKPMASELRRLFAIYRIVQNLERIADRVIKIVGLKQKINDIELYTKIAPKLNIVVKDASNMLKNAVDSFNNNDKTAVISVMKADLVFDNLNRDLMKAAMKEIELEVDTEKLLLSMADLRSIISSLDRIGDHSKNIAEASLYAMIGKNYMHQQIDETEL